MPTCSDLWIVVISTFLFAIGGFMSCNISVHVSLQADYFGVLACAHQLLYGDELRTIVESCACAERRGFTLPDRKISVHVQYSDLTTAASGSVEGGVTGCVRVPKVSLKRFHYVVNLYM